MASCFMMLLLLTCTIIWRPQCTRCAAGRATEELLGSPAAGPAVNDIPVPTKHAKSEDKIVGAADIVVQGTVNYNARIYNKEEGGDHTVCTGTLINSKQVLTAGHCCLGSIEIFVTLSAYDLEAWPPEEGVHKYTAVDKLLPRQYLKDRDQFKNWDVCVLILPEDVNITTAPIDAKSDHPIRPGTDGYVFGWGNDNDLKTPARSGSITTTILGGMNTETLPCSDFAGKTMVGGKVAVTEVWEESGAPMLICSAPRKDVGLCDGDSGAPLLVNGKVIGLFVESHFSRSKVPEGRIGCKAPITYLNVFINLAAPKMHDWITDAACLSVDTMSSPSGSDGESGSDGDYPPDPPTAKMPPHCPPMKNPPPRQHCEDSEEEDCCFGCSG